MQASAHILLLFLALLLESYLRVQHRKRQQAGFLAFYWSTRGLLSIPSRVTAVGQVSPATYAILSDNTGKYASWTRFQSSNTLSMPYHHHHQIV